MPTEITLPDGWAATVAPGVAAFGVGASGTEDYASLYLWTVPEDVFSISVLLYPGVTSHAGSHDGVIPPLALYNVPTVPGDVWGLEPGYPQRYTSSLGAVIGATFGGGAGGGGGGGLGSDGYGFAGASATVLSRRPGGSGTPELYAVLGGEGGEYQEGTYPPGFPTMRPTAPGPTTTGGPTGFPGSGGPGEAGGYLEAGGGGGWPGGAKAPAQRLAGLSGGNYLPSSTDLGGERSPTWEERFDGDPDPFPELPGPTDPILWFGALSVWYFTDDPTGWIIGAVGFG